MNVPEVKTKEKPVQYGAGAVSDLFGAKVRTCGNPRCSAIPPLGRIYCDGACRAEASRIRKAKEKSNEAQTRHDAERETFKEKCFKYPYLHKAVENQIFLFIKSDVDRIDMDGVIGCVRMLDGLSIPNAEKKLHREKFITDHPEHAHLFDRSCDLQREAT